MSEASPRLSLVDGPAPVPLTRKETRRRQRELEYATGPPATTDGPVPTGAVSASFPGVPAAGQPAPALDPASASDPVPDLVPVPVPVPGPTAASAPAPAPAAVRGGRRRPGRGGRSRTGTLPPGAAELLSVLATRPWLALDVADLVAVTGVGRREVLVCLESLTAQHRVTARTRDGRVCYMAAL